LAGISDLCRKTDAQGDLEIRRGDAEVRFVGGEEDITQDWQSRAPCDGT
jgi:hypothetical protein